MENGNLRHISDWATLIALGYQSTPITQVSSQDLAKYSLEPPLTRWLTGLTDTNIYFIKNGLRYRVPNSETLKATGGNWLNISLVSDEFLASFKLANIPLSIEIETLSPRATAALWANGFLWIANDAGNLTRWKVNTGQSWEYKLPGSHVIRALASDGENIYAGTASGNIWRLTIAGNPPPNW